MIKAVIFDRDGVLVDSEGINVMSAEKAMLTFGIQIDDEDKQHILGNHPRNYGPYLRTRYVFDLPKFREIQLQMYYDLFDETPVFPEAIALLKVLKEAGFRLALNTG
ncbi:MAG: HAD hydrolase-like protein [bacterium]